MAWGLAALFSIFLLSLLNKLDPAHFRECFIALCGFVMGANYGEHKEKAKVEAAEVAQAPVINVVETPK